MSSVKLPIFSQRDQTAPSVILKHFDNDSFIALSTLHCNGLSLSPTHYYITSTKRNSWCVVDVTGINERHEARAQNLIF